MSDGFSWECDASLVDGGKFKFVEVDDEVLALVGAGHAHPFCGVCVVDVLNLVVVCVQ